MDCRGMVWQAVCVRVERWAHSTRVDSIAIGRQPEHVVDTSIGAQGCRRSPRIATRRSPTPARPGPPARATAASPPCCANHASMCSTYRLPCIIANTDGVSNTAYRSIKLRRPDSRSPRSPRLQPRVRVYEDPVVDLVRHQRPALARRDARNAPLQILTSPLIPPRAPDRPTR